MLKRPEIRKILNVRVDSTSTSLVLDQIHKKLAQAAKFYVTTPNPEIVLKASKDKKLQDIIAGAFIAVPDGVGLLVASKFLTMPKIRNQFARKFIYPFEFLVALLTNKGDVVKGRELMTKLFTYADRKKLRVYLLGSTKEANSRAVTKFRRDNPGASVKGTAGPVLDTNAKPVGDLETKIDITTVDQIQKFSPDMLFVAFGCPRQEKWIAKWLPKLDIKMAMGVGGALDYYAGVTKIPPKWIDKAGLEWLWRLVHEPRKRMKRVISSVIVFPWKVYQFKLRSKI